MTESGCGAKIRPFPDSLELACGQGDGPHDAHAAALRDYAYPGSVTTITWLDSDWRNFRGAWRPCPVLIGCVLPDGHRGGCAS